MSPACRVNSRSPSSGRHGGEVAISLMATCGGWSKLPGSWTASHPRGVSQSSQRGSRCRWSGTHCSTALLVITSTGPAGAHSRRSASSKVSRGGFSSRRAASIISGELSTPCTVAPGQRRARSAVRFPGPQPRSTTVAGSSAPTRAIRSANGRLRSSLNRWYWPGSHIRWLLTRASLSRYQDTFRVYRSGHLDVKRYPWSMEDVLPPTQPRDEVDDLVAAWHTERPDLDVAPLQVLSRVSRLARHLDLARRASVASHRLATREWDVPSALRRQGPPYQMTPGALLRATLVTSGTMTNRIDRLAEAGLVRRQPDPRDRRGVLVTLTTLGQEKVDDALADLLRRERDLLAARGPADQQALAGLLRTRLAPFDAPAGGPAGAQPGALSAE